MTMCTWMTLLHKTENARRDSSPKYGQENVNLKQDKVLISTRQGRIQYSPEEGAPTLRGAPTYDFAKFCEKLHEIENILGRRGRPP